MFNSNMYSRSTEYHSYLTDDLALQSVGMSSYTKISMSGYLDSSNPDIVGFFGNNIDQVRSSLLGFTTPVTENLSILKFNSTTKEYELKQGDEIFQTDNGTSVATSLDDLLSQHNVSEWGITTTSDDLKQVIKNIQSSYSGCITFKPSFTATVGTLSQTRTPLVRLYLKSKNNSDKSRVLALNNPPIISAVPKRPTGATYGWQGTQDKPVGVYQKPSEGGNSNPMNTVAAPMRLTYNSNIGEWESGTQQMLARLLTDIDPAPLKPIPDDVDGIEPEDFYTSGSDYDFSQFTVGKALPLSLENANPHKCGPNMTAIAGGQNKKEKIQVVNRSPRSYKKGDVVMCSHIDGEWIIQGFDAGTVTTPQAGIKIGKWSFTKLLANSDVFFKDDRCFTSGGTQPQFNSNISPDRYETLCRKKFYAHMYTGGGDGAAPPITNINIKLLSELNDLNRIAKLNLYTPSSKPDLPYYVFDKIDETAALASPLVTKQDYDFQPSKKYVQATVFDQLGTHMGGLRDYNLIGRTNAYTAPNGGADNLFNDQSQIPHFWGPVFPDGYSSQQTEKLKTPRAMISLAGSPRLGYANDYGASSLVSANAGTDVLSVSPAKNKTLDNTNFMFSDTKDGNLLQLPAEVGTNGSLSGNYASPIEPLVTLMSIENEPNVIDGYASYLNNRSRYIWLANAADSGDIYGFSPVQPARIQFSPLQLELAAHAYTETNPIGQGAGSKYASLKNQFYSYLDPSVDKGIENGTWGDLLARTNNYFPNMGPDTFINGDGPLGGPDLLPDSDSSSGDEKSNFVGIIASKNKFAAKNSITFTTKQYFGLPKVRQAAGGQSGGISIIPIAGGIAFVGANNPSFTYGYPQWGSSEDKYDSFGTTALHVRVFDQWPDEQTIYDPRYFGVLHFNPLRMGGIVKSNTVDAGISFNDSSWTPASGINNVKYQRLVDKIEDASVDFRIPTYAEPRDSSVDNTPIPVGSIVTKDGVQAQEGFGSNRIAMRNPSEWRVNPIRRGQLLTKGGFRYYKRVIGVDPNVTSTLIASRGKDFTVGQKITNADKKIEIQISTINSEGGITAFAVNDKGEGLSVTDFKTSQKIKPDATSIEYTTNGYKINISGQNGDSGSGAALVFRQGLVYDKLQYDPCPLESTSSPSRLSMSSSRGEKVSEGEFTATVALSSVNNSSGKYDAFYFFHNDILHTVLSPGAFIPGYGQYVALEISAG